MSKYAHSTLTAATVASVTLDPGSVSITVTNRAGTGEIYFTVDGTTPTIGGTNCYVSLGARTVLAKDAGPSGQFGGGPSSAVVKLISTAALPYSVESEYF